MLVLIPSNQTLTPAEAVFYRHICGGYLAVRKTTSWVRLPSRGFMKKIFGNRYRDVVNSLIHKGLISEDNSWLAGEFSKGYRPIPTDAPMISQEFNGRVVDRYREHVAEFTKARSRAGKAPFKNDEQHLKAIEQDLNAMTIDPVAAEKDSLAEYAQKMQPVEGESPKQKKARELNATEFLFSCRMAIARITNGDHWLTVCAFNRKHTTVTNCPKVARNHIKMWNKDIQWHDVSNCQPLIMLNQFIQMADWDEGQTSHEMGTCLYLISKGEHRVNLTGTWDGSLRRIHQYETIREMPREEAKERIRASLEETIKYAQEHKTELKTALKEAAEGKYYEWMMQITDSDRDTCKKLHMQVAYGRPANPPEGMETLVKACQLYKGCFYHVLPKRITLTESAIFTRVSKRLWERGIHHITAHDSIGAAPEHTNTIKTMIAEEFVRETEQRPTIDKEEWQEEEEKSTGGSNNLYVVQNREPEIPYSKTENQERMDRILWSYRGPPG